MWTFALASLLTLGAFGQTADEIVERARQANQVERSIQSVTMTIVSKSGSERVRELELRSQRNGEATASYIEVTAPSDIAGTKLLSVEEPGQREQQTLKLPSYEGLKRIGTSQKKGSFLGSDFTYEDLGIREAAKGKHTLVSDDASVWVIETIPSDSPQYAKVRAHITKADLVARTIEFFDKKNTLVKVLEVTETTTRGDTTLPRKTVMRNVQKSRHTELHVTEQRIGVPPSELPTETFTPAYLER